MARMRERIEPRSDRLAKEFGIAACGPLPPRSPSSADPGRRGSATSRGARRRRAPLGLLMLASTIGLIPGEAFECGAVAGLGA